MSTLQPYTDERVRRMAERILEGDSAESFERLDGPAPIVGYFLSSVEEMTDIEEAMSLAGTLEIIGATDWDLSNLSPEEVEARIDAAEEPEDDEEDILE